MKAGQMSKVKGQMSRRGFTLVEVLVGSFLMLIVFLGIFGAYQLGIKVVGLSRNKVIATALANKEIERIRNVPYAAIGTVGGFPEGALLAEQTQTIGGVDYQVATRIDYVVDAADGVGSPADTCPNDYKRATITISWSGLFSGNVKLATDITPNTLAEECAEQGGILLVSAFDAFGIMVPSPLIEVKDSTTDVTVKSATPAEGRHFFSLEPATYKIVVSKSGYSSERTYSIDEVATPENPHPTVLENELTEMSFAIDRVSTFQVETRVPWSVAFFADTFQDDSQVAELVEVTLENSEVHLARTGEVYMSGGYLVSSTIASAPIVNWDTFSWQDVEPADTSLAYQILYWNDDVWVLVPEIHLPGNAAGFSASPVDLSLLDTAQYGQIRLKAIFSTNDTAVTPTLYEWQVSWRTTDSTPVPSTLFHLRGEKVIGYDAEEDPVYKYDHDHTTDTEGTLSLENIEWDVYTFSIPPGSGLDVSQIDPEPQPIGIAPNTTMPVILYVQAQNSLLMSVSSAESAEPIFAASVRLFDGDSYDATQYTAANGQTYFIPLTAGSYSLEISAPGHTPYSGSVDVSGDETKVVPLEQVE